MTSCEQKRILREAIATTEQSLTAMREQLAALESKGPPTATRDRAHKHFGVFDRFESDVQPHSQQQQQQQQQQRPTIAEINKHNASFYKEHSHV